MQRNLKFIQVLSMCDEAEQAKRAFL